MTTIDYFDKFIGTDKTDKLIRPYMNACGAIKTTITCCNGGNIVIQITKLRPTFDNTVKRADWLGRWI